MDTRIWMGVLLGALAALVVVGGIVVVSAATGPGGAMGGMMHGGMMGSGDMEAMHAECRGMMEERGEGGGGPEGDPTGTSTAPDGSVAAMSGGSTLTAPLPAGGR